MPQMSLPDTSLASGSGRKRMCFAPSSTDSNRVPARVIGDIIDVGTNDWSAFVRENKLLVDKTDLLLGIMKPCSSNIIFRPPRFGKTMFFSMTHDFFNVARTDEELTERMRIFKEMNIHKVDPTFVDEHCGRYPVIYINLKNVRSDTLDEFRDSMAQAISAVIDEWHYEIYDTSKMEINEDRDTFNRMKRDMGSDTYCSVSIPRVLVDYLSEYYNAPCIVLVDEFDASVANIPTWTREMVKRYMLELLSPLAKNNNNVRKFIMVGIDPVNLGSSGGKINNCTWHPLYKHSDRSREDASLYQFAFGFTEEEVGALIGRVADKMGLVEGQADKLRGVARKWYGGYYACKGVPLYNPWSIMSYIKDITKSRETCLEAVESGSVSRYWLSTGHTMALAKFFRKAGGIRCWILEIWKFVVDFLNLVNAANGSVPNYEPQIRFCMVYNPRAIKNPEDVLAKMQWRFITGAGVDQCVVSIADSVEIMSAIDSLNVREFMTMLYHRGCLSVKDGAYLMIPNYEVLCAWLDSIGLDRLADRLVSGVSGRPVLVDHLLSGEYPEFIEHVERVLEAQGREITAWMPKYFYQGLLSMMLSLFLDSSKYDIAHKVSIDIGRPTVVVKPRLGATDDGTTEGSGRESMGVLIEIKQASPWTVDKDARTLTADDARFIEDEAKDRTERARRKLGDKTFESLKGLLATGYDRALKKYLNTFNECCDEVLVIVASFSGKHCLFRFEYFKRTRVAWSLDPERHPVVDDLACPYNWPGL